MPEVRSVRRHVSAVPADHRTPGEGSKDSRVREEMRNLFSFFWKTEIFFQLCNGGTALPPIIDTKYGVILSLKGEDNVKMGQIAFLDRFSFC